MNISGKYSTSNNRNKYDVAFKRDMVGKLIESRKSVSEFAVYAGVKRINLQKWKQKYGPEFENKQQSGKPELLRKQIKTLSNDLAELQETVEHLRNIVKRSLTIKYIDSAE